MGQNYFSCYHTSVPYIALYFRHEGDYHFNPLHVNRDYFIHNHNMNSLFGHIASHHQTSVD